VRNSTDCGHFALPRDRLCQYDRGSTSGLEQQAEPVSTGPGPRIDMRKTSLRFRYLLTILLVGVGLTAGVALTVSIAREHGTRIVPTVIALGLGLSLVATFVAWRLIARIDTAMRSLIESSDRIGSGLQSQPVEHTGVQELLAIEDALERMRQRLRVTTISRDYLDTLLNSMSDAVLVTAPDGRIRSANAAAQQLLGMTTAELADRDFKSLVAEQHLAAFDNHTVSSEPGETVIRTARGQTIPVSLSLSPISSADPGFQGQIYVLRDITERKRAERRIRYLARFDALTKMPNRMQFQHMLHQAITRTTRQSRGLALLYVDVDNFKEINDTFGHAAGDRVLETVSERLIRSLPRESVVGRLAGDEFAIFVEGPEGSRDRHEQAASLARQLLAEIAKPLHVGEHEIEVTISIGIAQTPEDADNVIDLIRDADAAMYHAKRAGRNCHVFYSPEMNAAAVERLLLKSKLRRALERQEFVLRYQPKVDLASGDVVGAEALLRWRLPGHGDIAPAQFIPLAEESRLILDIGAWVLNQVCSDYAAWQKKVADPGRIAINLSLKELSYASFIPRCRSVFEQHGVAPSRVELEITETTLMMDAERTLPLLDELRSMGVHLSIDDFGTGYSSLSALQQFPIGTLKIDQSFVRNAATDPDDATIVRTIIEMGRSLGLQVVAEGIETDEQRQFLRQSGCQFGQGRLFGEPIAATEFLDLMIRQATGEHPVLRLPA
jgi:diguanylate cyclase (GGDEF)-like protein/PAS domain S-box-containing protein